MNHRSLLDFVCFSNPGYWNLSRLVGKSPELLARAKDLSQRVNPCIQGWPSRAILNYDYQLVNLSEAEFQFLEAITENSGQLNLGEILAQTPLELEKVRSLQQQQLIILSYPRTPRAGRQGRLRRQGRLLRKRKASQ